MKSNGGDSHLRSRMPGSIDTYFRGSRGESLHVETKILDEDSITCGLPWVLCHKSNKLK